MPCDEDKGEGEKRWQEEIVIAVTCATTRDRAYWKCTGSATRRGGGTEDFEEFCDYTILEALVNMAVFVYGTVQRGFQDTLAALGVSAHLFSSRPFH